MGKLPKYQIVLEKLRQEILKGKLAPAEKLPGEDLLARQFDVSRITVRHAVSELQRQGLVDRTAGSGTYVKAARPPAGLVFGLVIPNLGETEIFEPICQAIAASPDAAGHALLWAHAGKELPREEHALALAEQCIARRVNGVFFAPLEFSNQSVEVNRRVMSMLRDENIPVVLLDRRPSHGTRCDLAGIDNYHAGVIATAHLERLGARRVAFLGYEDQALTVERRIAGYKDTVHKGFDHDVLLVPREGELRLPPCYLGCDAYVCANDRVAGRLMHFLLARRYKIPEDVKIVGIDDVHYAALLPVPLTTVHQPCREIGEAALRLMLDRIANPKLPAREVLVDCELVIRQSCGAVPVKDLFE